MVIVYGSNAANNMANMNARTVFAQPPEYITVHTATLVPTAGKKLVPAGKIRFETGTKDIDTRNNKTVIYIRQMSVHTTEALVKGQSQYNNKNGEQALQIAASLPLKSKNLLEKIILTSSLLNKELMLRGNGREIRLVNTILTSAWSLWNEMSTIIDIATLETEGLHLYFRPVAINGAIHCILDRVLPKLQNRQQVLTLKLTPKSPRVMADQLRLEQILLTILSQVSLNTAAHGSIFITTAEQSEIVTIKVWGEPVAAASSTTDTPYNQAGYNREKLTSGITTELALCKYLVKLHKGKLCLPDETTAGNTFVVVLPSICN